LRRKKEGEQKLTGCDWNWTKYDSSAQSAKMISLTASVNDDDGFTNKYVPAVKETLPLFIVYRCLKYTQNSFSDP